MAVSLLTTKLYVPRARADLVSRQRLLARLRGPTALPAVHKLTLISAPAGFGKTTLLSEWAATCDHPVAWVSLDEGDNDPIRFWSYVIAALGSIPALADAEIGRAVFSRLGAFPLANGQDAALDESLLAELINEIAAVPHAGHGHAFSLVLDDFHLITASEIHRGLVFLLDHLPPQMHLVISCRADPPWPLARMRVRGELVELRTRELRFTAKETQAFLNATMQLPLAAEDIRALQDRTEGWIAGLQMAALTMQGHAHTSSPEAISQFIRSFTGTNRFILDYLIEEVIGQQPEDVRTFLLETSILERMTGSLCDAVADRQGSEDLLSRLEHVNLFLIPLDDDRRWYRYHHLFGDLLRSRLAHTHPGRLPKLHARASAWFARHGSIVDAVRHALAADDVERVANLVAGNALAIMGHTELPAIEHWLSQAIGTHLGRLDEVNHRLRDVQDTLATAGDMPSAEREHISGQIASIRAYIAGLRGEISAAADLTRAALRLLPERDLIARGFATSLLGSALRWCGDLAKAEAVSAQAIDLSLLAGYNRVAADAFCDMAALQLVQGRLHDAAATCRNALQLADAYAYREGRQLPVAGFAHARMSAVLCEWNQLDAALDHARQGVELCEQWEWADGLVFGYLYLADAWQAAGDPARGLRATDKALHIADRVSPWLASYVAANRARLWLASGDLPAASRWARESGLTPQDEISYQWVDWYETLTRVLLAEGRLAEAQQVYAQLLRLCQEAGAMGHVVRMLVAQAIAWRAMTKLPRALAALERALALAEPEGYVRTFVSQGPPMHELLSLLLRQGASRSVDYVRRLLAAMPGATAADAASARADALVEPLTNREREVLRLLMTDLSSTEIARELYVSANTVRSHIKNIYGKLSVHGRAEAVARAIELGLL